MGPQDDGRANGAGSRRTPAGVPSPVPPGVTPEIDSAEYNRLTADISARLRGVCAHLSDEAFADLVVDIVRVRVRYDIVLRQFPTPADPNRPT